MSQLHSDWLLTAERAAVHRPSATAVIADLHLGYHEARARGGEAVPAADLAEVLAPLSVLAKQHGVRRLVVAGDLFEAGWDANLWQTFRESLQVVGLSLAALVPGNHDRRVQAADATVPIYVDGFDVAGWRIVHGDATLPAGLVVYGHVHPCVRWSGGSAAPCFLRSDRQIVLPAFSPDAAGVNVLGKRGWAGHECHVIAGRNVLNFGAVRRLGRSTLMRVTQGWRKPTRSASEGLPR